MQITYPLECWCPEKYCLWTCVKKMNISDYTINLAQTHLAKVKQVTIRWLPLK